MPRLALLVLALFAFVSAFEIPPLSWITEVTERPICVNEVCTPRLPV